MIPKKHPNSLGYFGPYGGRFIPEILFPALEQLTDTYLKLRKDRIFQSEFTKILHEYSGRPTPLYFAENFTRHLKGPQIYIKREDLNHTGAHKITNCLGQALIVKRMRKKRVIAETGAGQHGVATASACAKFGFDCTIYMGEIDYFRQRPNVFWMERMGAKVVPVSNGTRVLKDAVNCALKDWITNFDSTHYLLGSALGPHPYPLMVRDFQSVIGKEVKKQIRDIAGKLPDTLIACVGGGSNSIGLFYPFLRDTSVEMIGVEAGGRSLKSGEHAARFSSSFGKVGICQGYKSYFLQDEDGNLADTHSISAGLDYSGVGPEHSFLHDEKRIRYRFATDKEVIEALTLFARLEGIIPALESSHAIAEVIKIAPKRKKNEIIVVNLSGRGDKDIFIIAEALKDKAWSQFIHQKSEEYK